jgi:cob(I)alamin adenosyltransferase
VPVKRIDKKGFVQIYTGAGKGKTTASLGLAMRACGHGWKVMMICFMKGDPNYGEVESARHLPNFILIQSGLPSFVKKGEPTAEDLRLAKQGYQRAVGVLEKNEVDLLILDEINVALDYGLLSLDNVLLLLEKRPPSMDLVFTGRYAHLELVKSADLVSEILEIKHPYQKGIIGREGIDF